MAYKRLSMRKIREILRLYHELKLGKKLIAKACSVSPSTVVDYVRKAETAGLSWPLPDDLDDSAIEALLFPAEPPKTPDRPLPVMAELRLDLQTKGVTLMLLWQEYKERYPEGYQYSQFCDIYRRWTKTLDLSLRQEYLAGEKMFIDFAGKTIPITNRYTGEITEAEIFVAVLGASNYTYAVAVESQNLPSWIGSHTRAFEYFGGVSALLIPDNLKSGVTKACRYEPELNPTYLEMCQYYGTVAMPARAGKPRDKSKVEAGVLLVTRWITAALRHRTFFSITELNAAIRELLERLNNRKFKKLDSSRRQLFEAIDKPALKPLPVERYQYAEWKKATVNIDYHIEVERHFYSVPYQLVRQKVDVRITSDAICVLFKGKRITSHPRSYYKGKFTTITEHMPKSHQGYKEWTPSRLISWAEKTGPSTSKLIETIMTTRPHPQQGFRSCLGIMTLGKKYTNERLEAASHRALAIRSYSYRSIRAILESGLDKVATETKEVMPAIEHDNIRGQQYYV
jgi:transposase